MNHKVLRGQGSNVLAFWETILSTVTVYGCFPLKWPLKKAFSLKVCADSKIITFS